MLFKLAERFAKKYAVDEQNVDHWGVDPETGTGIVPEFENGDLVEHKGRTAVYISKMHWQEPRKSPTTGDWEKPNKAMIQYLDKSPITKNPFFGKEFNFDYVPEKELKLIMKKDERAKQFMEQKELKVAKKLR